MTAEERRAAVIAKYKTILGRNNYSQSLRNYCFKKYTNGKYYSDCSSSVSYSYKEAGYGFGILNTVGMYQSKKFTNVPVTIKNGQVQNTDVLRVGDMLLFAGTDKGRSYAGYVGHVEMVGEISGKTVMLYGHGSGNPKRHEMVAYCRSRYNAKTSTKVGNKGLIRVRRFIVDDAQSADPVDVFNTLHFGAKGTAVVEMQEALMSLGYDLPDYGADGDFGDETKSALIKFQSDRGLDKTGIYDAATDAALRNSIEPMESAFVQVTGMSVNIRSDCDLNSMKIGIAHRGDQFEYSGEQSGTWYRIKYNDSFDCWISSKYSEIVKKGNN